jgi:hypothetical protein
METWVIVAIAAVVIAIVGWAMAVKWYNRNEAMTTELNIFRDAEAQRKSKEEDASDPTQVEEVDVGQVVMVTTANDGTVYRRVIKGRMYCPWGTSYQKLFARDRALDILERWKRGEWAQVTDNDHVLSADVKKVCFENDQPHKILVNSKTKRPVKIKKAET